MNSHLLELAAPPALIVLDMEHLTINYGKPVVDPEETLQYGSYDEFQMRAEHRALTERNLARQRNFAHKERHTASYRSK